MNDITIVDANEAFGYALLSGTLSHDVNSPRFVGHYMYMYTRGFQHWFKHTQTREYRNTL